MDHNAIAGDVDRGKMWEAHQMVAVQMRDENVVSLRIGNAVAGYLGLPQRPGATPHVADEMIRTVANDFDTRGVTAKSTGDVEGQGVDKLVKGFLGLECLAIGRGHGGDDLFPDFPIAQRDRHGATRPPEHHLFHEPSALQAVSIFR